MTNRGKQTPISPCHVKGVALDTAISDRSPVEYGPNLNTMRAQNAEGEYFRCDNHSILMNQF